MGLRSFIDNMDARLFSRDQPPTGWYFPGLFDLDPMTPRTNDEQRIVDLLHAHPVEEILRGVHQSHVSEPLGSLAVAETSSATPK